MAELPNDAFTRGTSSSCTSGPENIKVGSPEYWQCQEGGETVIDLKRTNSVTMVEAQGMANYMKKFELHYSLDGNAFMKIEFSTYDVRMIASRSFFADFWCSYH